ncbi:MAG: DUF2934 domain-containing protein [Pseudomonadota bacterium]|uniref:DUF2934 domain-containing protein n=1 Tax=Salinicola salarius TaxID=430457 RepID=UPI0026ED810F|nr:DUF2934 domain-containing protein [Salinicola salarius]MED5500437.1 DUF2934 domain-containing protein [Pseudomonadota bacterium]
MMTSREQRVRMLAYRIWESEGRPDDQDDRHWEMAERIVEAENAREEEQDWRAASDEPSLLEGEEPPAEPDELGIDEMRLPLDDPETEARKEEDTGVEIQTQPSQAKPSTRSKAASSGTGEGKPASRKRAVKKATDGERDKPAPKPRKPRGTSSSKSE